ncbi:ImmA/IrrE family metallo-endopeptidase [Lactiplantibacillus plantarum]|uniref:ImmA/IrrE family metallo-endopeptidase n=1 Tax=Lactiplantibacillus plantarum TaxID=1590 RepID=UPI000CE978C8|nr:ImmA/IrrE family metallo-endopeptidase [Lactiplantibacillus plantarum]AVE83897.1 hypothetical protein C4O30_13220 [Lactiplantibacillus plantarum]QJP86421.1 ImmA/IrrE family metallo-endopeptidase [Lactiplantibacillus plantarum]
MKYREVYPQDFIEKLNGINDVSGIDGDQSISGDYIDVEDMLKKLGFTVSKKSLRTGSGEIDDNIITIDETENKNRQRFTMAHELGHAFRHERNAKRNDTSDGYSSKERQSEIFANAFAAQLLMPKPLVKKQVTKVVHDLGINMSKISADEYDQIVTKTAEKMIVSKQAMGYRIQNLKIFVPIGE